MNNYTYQLYFPATNMFYIGSRSDRGCSPEEDSGYLGSSKYTPKYAVVEKTILMRFSTHKEALEHEILLHEIFDVARSNKFYNRAKAISTGFSVTGISYNGEKGLGNKNAQGLKHSEDTKNKISVKIKAHYENGVLQHRKMTDNEKLLLRSINQIYVYHTPYGSFISAQECANILSITRQEVQSRCFGRPNRNRAPKEGWFVEKL